MSTLSCKTYPVKVISFRAVKNDFDEGMASGSKSALTGDSTPDATMLMLSTGYADPMRFMRGFRESYRITKERGDLQ